MSIKYLTRARTVYHEYPRQFWIAVAGLFVDAIGGAVVFPFFSLYISWKFDVGMTTVGLLLGTFSIAGIVGSTIGGALTDRWGRKSLLLFGLVASATSSVLLGVANSLEVFFITALFVGVFSRMGGPAAQAMVADLLSEEQRAQGFAIMRVLFNLAITIGPALGGLLARRSYMALFIMDAVTSVVVAIALYFVLKETKPASSDAKSRESFWETFKGYGSALRDPVYMTFIVACTLATIVYMQMFSTLAVYLRDVHSVSEQYFGYMISLNAGMVVLLQFSVTRWIKAIPPLKLMAISSALYAIGFATYGLVASYPIFLIAAVIITVGEMIAVPTSQAVAAQMAPEDKRGRYMAVYSYVWTIPGIVGPTLAGLVMDNADPRLVWYAAGVICLVSAASFVALRSWNARRDQVLAQAPAAEPVTTT